MQPYRSSQSASCFSGPSALPGLAPEEPGTLPSSDSPLVGNTPTGELMHIIVVPELNMQASASELDSAVMLCCSGMLSMYDVHTSACCMY